jgi:Dolichyl-phosphate-mannose-protein mannosyltransferase
MVPLGPVRRCQSAYSGETLVLVYSSVARPPIGGLRASSPVHFRKRTGGRDAEGPAGACYPQTDDVSAASGLVMPTSAGKSGGVAHILQPPTYAVVAAFCVRALLLVASYRAQYRYHLDLEFVGREAAMIASSLASGKGFANAFDGYEMATAWLAPVFPALWSLAFRAFPIKLSHGGIYAGQLMNSAFSAFTCWPIYWLGRRLFGAGTGLAAAWAWVILPTAILFPLEWLWDQSLSALVLTLLLCATYQVREAEASSLVWMGYGCLWGFAALLNPTLCVLLPFLAAWIAWGRRREGLATGYPLMKTFLFCVLCVLPWTARNFVELDGLVFVKSNFGLELWLGNNPHIPADDLYSPQLHPDNNFRELLPLVFSGEPKYMQNKERDALVFIRAHPRTFLELVGLRVLDTWTAAYDSRHDKWMRPLRLVQAEVVFCTAFSLLSLFGLALALRKNADQVLPLALSAVVFPIPYYITHTALRYRHPIDPVLTLLAVFAVAEAARWRRATAAPQLQKHGDGKAKVYAERFPLYNGARAVEHRLRPAG